MHRLLTALGRGFKEKIGWKRLGIAASLIIVIFAVATLVRTLKGVDTGIILTALTEIAPHRIALAALCVVAAFCTLTFYDFFALRTIGKTHVPYRIAAMSSFTSYTIGHNIGATVFTGGAIRFRIYSDYGLTAIDVAKICFLSGLTFWLGNLFVLGMGMAWHPEAATAMDLLPPAMNRMIAIGCLAGIAAYFVWLLMGQGRRELGQNGWKVVLPSARLTLLQVLIGVVDLGFCALAMYLLMPTEPHIDFVSLAVVFILATLLGFASHSPGGLGVFATQLCRLSGADCVGVVSSAEKGELCKSLGACDYIDADLREPDRILEAASRTLDFSQPVALMLVAILLHITSDEEAYAIVRRLVDLLAPGSYLVIVHDTADIHSEEIETAMRYFMDQGGEPLVARSREEITRFFNGLELVEPGLVTTSRWRPEPKPSGEPEEAEEVAQYAGVARKP